MFHKKLLQTKLKRLGNPLFIVLSILQGLNWYFYRLWKIIFVVVSKKGSQIRTESDISKLKLIYDMFMINILYQIDPFIYCRYKLYLKGNRKNIHKYIFRTDLPYFHDYINREICDNYRKLIADKQVFSEEMKKLNIPAVKTIFITDHNSEIETFFREEDIFCKPICGSQSRNAFEIKYFIKENKYEIHPIIGHKIIEKDKITAFLKQIIKSEKLLIQESLKDHPSLSEINDSDEITTIRIITAEFKDKQIKPIYMQLEVPLETKHEKTFRQFYKIYPLDLVTFDVAEEWKLKTKVNYETDIIIANDIRKMISKSIEYCLKTHKKLLKLKSVAFDLALTPDGPVMIEANYNWNIEMLYNIINEEPVTYNENIPF